MNKSMISILADLNKDCLNGLFPPGLARGTIYNTLRILYNEIENECRTESFLQKNFQCIGNISQSVLLRRKLI